MKYIVVILIITLVIGGCSGEFQSTYISGTVTEKEMVEIDTLRWEHWMKIVFVTDTGTEHWIDAPITIYRNVEVGDRISMKITWDDRMTQFKVGE